VISPLRRPSRHRIAIGFLAGALVGGVAVLLAAGPTRLTHLSVGGSPLAVSGGSSVQAPATRAPATEAPTASAPSPSARGKHGRRSRGGGSGAPGASASELAGFLGADFAGKPFCLFKSQNATISTGTLTVTYPAGSSAPSAGAPYGGAQLCDAFAGGGARDATLSYDVRFPVGFQFVKGGKLPGMYGGVQPFSGGKHNPKGWSMRLMWRADGAAEVYGYISNTTGYGDSWGRGNFSFQADGQWHHLTEHIHLNTPGQSDGYVTLAYDGTTHINQTGLAITTTDTPIDGLFFSTFYGGHDASWAPSADMHLDFANFKASGSS
jgi:hypothetical protein